MQRVLFTATYRTITISRDSALRRTLDTFFAKKKKKKRFFKQLHVFVMVICIGATDPFSPQRFRHLWEMLMLHSCWM